MSFMIISIVFISVFGTAAHFMYDFFNHNKFVGLFCAVNESTWEHIKIALTPTIIWGLVDGYIYGGNPNYFLAKFISLASIIFVMPLLFYGYKLFFKKNNVLYNCSIFYVVVIISQYLFDFLINYDAINYLGRYLSFLGIVIIFICYLVFTLMPLNNFLFRDPITNKFGFCAHSEEYNIFKNRGR